MRVWDARSHASAVQQMSLDGLGSCTGVEWCPTSPYLLSATSYGERVLIFDVRMTGSTPESPHVCSIEPKTGVQSSLWLQDSSFMGEKAGILAITTNDGSLEFWETSFGGMSGDHILEASCEGENASANIQQSSILLATARGLGVVSCSAAAGTGEVRQDSSYIAQHTSQASAPPSSVGTSTGDARGLFDVRLHSAPGPNEGDASDTMELAKVSASGILGCFWANEKAGPASGLELVCFTDSSSLLSIKISGDVFKKMCINPPATSGSGGTGKDKVLPVKPAPAPPAVLKTGKLQAPPRYSLASLRDNSAQLAPLPRRESKEEGMGGSDAAVPAARFWAGLREGVLSLEDLAQRGDLTGLSMGRIDQYARQVSLSLSFRAIAVADANEAVHNVTTSTFSPAPAQTAGQDRVVALIIRFPTSSLPSFALRGLEGKEEKIGSDLTAALGKLSRSISRAGSAPKAASKEEGGDEKTFLVLVATNFRQAFLSPANAWLEGLRAAVSAEAKTGEAEEAKDRIVNVLSDEGAKEKVAEAADSEEGKGQDKDKSEEAEAEETKREVAVVDALAYRVPCPADGGSCWGPGGRLVCFGRSVLSFGATSSSSPDDDDEDGVGPSLETQTQITRVTSGLKTDAAGVGQDAGGAGAEVQSNSRDDPRVMGSTQVSEVLKLGSDLSEDRGEDGGAAEENADPPSGSGAGAASKYPKSLGDLLVIRLAEREAVQRSRKGKDPEELDLLSSPEPPRARRRVTRGSTAGTPLGGVASDEQGNTDGDESLGRHDEDSYSDSDSDGPGGSGDEEFGEGATSKAGIARGKLYRQVTDEPKHLRGVHASLDRLGKRLDQQQEQKSGISKERGASQSTLTSYTALSDAPRAAAQALSLGPVNCDTTTAPLWSAGFCVDGGVSSKYDADARELYIASLKERISACKHNARVMESVPGLKRYFPHSVQQLWTLMASSLKLLLVTLEGAGQADKEGNTMLNWNSSIIGGRLLRKLLLMLVQSQELQLLATVVCILGGSNHTLKLLEVSTSSPQAAKGARPRSSSLTEAPLETDKLRRLLDRALYGYACILERWSLLTLATEVRNHIKWRSLLGLSEDDDSSPTATSATPNSSVTEFALEQEVLCSPETCFRCGEALDGDESPSTADRRRGIASGARTRPLWWCWRCKDFSSYCSLCQLPLDGPAFVCVGCGHGGHIDHIKKWFKTSVECATGCGCRCAELALSQRYLQRQRASTAAVEAFADDDDEYADDTDKGIGVVQAARRVADEDESSASDSYSDSDYDDDESDDGPKGRYQSYLDLAASRDYLHEGYGWDSDD